MQRIHRRGLRRAARVARTGSVREARVMSKHTLTITLDAEITDEAALVESVASATPEGSLSPEDIREEDRASSTLVAGVSKALKDLSVPGVEIGEPKVVSRDE